MNLLALALVLPLVGGLLSLALLKKLIWQQVVCLLLFWAHLALSIVLLVSTAQGESWQLSMGSWPVPIAISLRLDLISAILLVVTGLLMAGGYTFSIFDPDKRSHRPMFAPLLMLLSAATTGAFITSDLFNLFVWFELMLMSSFVLMTLGETRKQFDGAMHYVATNLVSSAFFLIAVGMVYAVAHTLDMNDLRPKLTLIAEKRPGLVLSIGTLLALAFSIKAALFPLFAWLPASYPAPSATVSAIFAGLLTKVGIYAMLRVFGSVFPPLAELSQAMLWLGSATMLIGVLAAVIQTEIRRILSFHVVSQVGYIVLGVGFISAESVEVRVLGVGACIFYAVHHMVVKTNLFLLGGIVYQVSGSTRLSETGGIARVSPMLAALFLIPALSLAGIPPLSGFWAKLATFKALVTHGQVVAIVCAAVAGLFTIISMLKIWNATFARTAETTPPLPSKQVFRMLLPVGFLAVVTLLLSFQPDLLLEISYRAAESLLGVKL